jgi:3-(3-hydroxy-phenyl)propionate hydroxylase
MEYVGSPINTVSLERPSSPVRAGMPAPEARLEGVAGETHLTEMFGAGFVLLCYSANGELPRELAHLGRSQSPSPVSLVVACIASSGRAATNVYLDRLGQFRSRYAAAPGCVYLIRPDGYLAACWSACGATEVRAALVTCGLTANEY